MEISKELKVLLDIHKNTRQEAKNAYKNVLELALIEYEYLIGKQVKVFGHKAWNIGTIIKISPRLDPILDDFFVTVHIKGPNNEVLFEEIGRFKTFEFIE